MNYQEAIKGYTGIIQAYAVAARTHDSLTSDAWAVMAREISAALKNSKSVDDIKQEMKVAEDAWKASTGDTSMPSTYRSAKAVALKAAANGVELVGTDGSVVGKTAVENAYKAKIAAATADPSVTAKGPVDPETKLKIAIATAWPKLTETQRQSVRDYVAAI